VRQLIVGNWKMNGSHSLCKQYEELANIHEIGQPNVVVCPPYPFLSSASISTSGRVQIGAQDCSTEKSGARTGEVSAALLNEFGVSYCIVGHSERRQNLLETDDVISKKLAQLSEHYITPILCIGEAQQERDTEQWRAKLVAQLSILSAARLTKIVVAYEPNWSIGTGKVPTSQEIDEALFFIRKTVADMGLRSNTLRILYGGSADDKNAARLLSLESVDGLLVGGASLDIGKFANIVRSAVDTNWAMMRS
jgi:triosephosphate isomerase